MSRFETSTTMGTDGVFSRSTRIDAGVFNRATGAIDPQQLVFTLRSADDFIVRYMNETAFTTNADGSRNEIDLGAYIDLISKPGKALVVDRKRGSVEIA